MPNKKISELSAAGALTGVELVEAVQGGLNVQTTTQAIADLVASGITREFNRAWSSELLFDKNEIDYTPHELTGNVTFTTAATGHLVNQFSGAVQRIITDGTQSIDFSGDFDFVYGIERGAIPDAGTYQIFFLYRNGVFTVNWTEPSSEAAAGTALLAPANFAAVADGENAIDLSWDDVTNESSYLIEVSLTGTGGWSTLSTPAAGSTSDSQTGLSASDQRFYRIKAVGDGVNFFDSPYSTASATTEDSGDVTAPTFTFSPTNGSNTHSVNAPIVITASEALQNADGSALTDANVAAVITLKQTNSGGANIAFTATIDVSKMIITITPTTLYGASQLVYVAIDNVEDASGNESVLTSITFTTTDYTTFFNGTSDRVIFGDILDSVFAAAGTNFWLEVTIKDFPLTGAHRLWGKSDGNISGTGDTFTWYYSGTDVFLFFYMGSSTVVRVIKWTGVLTSGEHELVLKYNGALNTNDGLDRGVLEIDGVVAGSKSLTASGGSLGALTNSTAQLAFGIIVNAMGTPIGTSYFTGDAKDLIIRSNSGATVELNVPIIRAGTDTSGNGRNGTWV